MEFWNSADQLGKINAYLQMALVAFGIATGLIGAASFIASYRKDSLLASEEAKFKEQVGSIDKRTSDIKSLTTRHLSKEQAEALRTALIGSKKMKVLAIRHNSKESQQFASEIEAVLKSVGWEVEHFIPFTRSRDVSSPAIGLNQNIPVLTEFESLKQGLEKAGLPFKAGTFVGDTKYQISVDAGIIPANDYQSLIDKIN